MSFASMKLGKLPPHPADKSKRLMLKAYEAPSLQPPPSTYRWDQAFTSFPLYGNDRYGDCVFCAITDVITTLFSIVWGVTWTPGADDVLAFYAAVTGFNPEDPSTDRGCVIEDALAYVHKHGFQKHYMIASAGINPADATSIKQAICEFGAVILGVAMPLSWQASRTAWRMPTDMNGDNAPGTWGGHCIWSSHYDAKYLYIWTWGTKVAVEWAAVAAYFDTVDVPIMGAWIKSGLAKSGYDLDKLKADLKAFS